MSESPDTPRSHDEQIDQGIHDLEATTERLFSAVTELGARISTTQEIQEGLEAATLALRRQQDTMNVQKRFNRLVKWVIAGFAVVLALFGYLLVRVDENGDKIRTVSCGLYNILNQQIIALGAQGADSDGDGEITALEQNYYDQIVQLVKDSRDALDCAG